MESQSPNGQSEAPSASGPVEQENPKSSPSPQVSGWLVLVLGASLLGWLISIIPSFPGKSGVGHDFALSLPGIVEGTAWIQSAGWFAPPWFSPFICGGVFLFAEPQSAHYSIFQLAAQFMDPLSALALGALVLSILGALGTFLWLRAMDLKESACALGAMAFALNGMFFGRFLIGETGFLSLAFLPWFAWAVAKGAKEGPLAWPWWAAVPAAGLALELSHHTGSAGILAVFAVSWVACSGLALGTRKNLSAMKWWLISAGAGLFFLALGAWKLDAALSALAQFPRTGYEKPGFADGATALIAPWLQLMLPGEDFFKWATQKLSGGKYLPLPHEWELSAPWAIWLSLVLGGICALAGKFKMGESAGLVSGENALPCAKRLWLLLALAALLFPGIALWRDPMVQELLSKAPILGSMAWPMRWSIALLLPMGFLAALSAHQFPEGKAGKWLCAGLIGAAIIPSGMRFGDYYQSKDFAGFDTRPSSEAWRKAVQGQMPPIERMRKGDITSPERNQAFFEGESEVSCYNPLYGYRLEFAPKSELKAGSIMQEDASGFLNILNPSCLVWPKENACAPGDRFKASEKEKAIAFANRKPFAFEVSARQMAARAVSIVAWLLLLGALVMVWRRKRKDQP